MRPLTSSPISQSRCPSDQQAGHVTRRTAIASKNNSQGLSQQLSNLQSTNKTCVFKRNTLINECTWLQCVPTGYRLHNFAQLTQPNRLQSPPTWSIQLWVYSGEADSKHLQYMASTDRLQSLSTGHTACTE